jgi:hypothetical protein
MYNNIGRKMKITAIVVAIAETILFIVIGAVIIEAGNDTYGYAYGYGSSATVGWFFLFGAPVIGWLSSLTLYGFGELIERAQGIHEILLMKNNAGRTAAAPFQPQPHVQPQPQPRHGGDPQQRRTWTCQVCGQVNDLSNMYCIRCSRH